MFIVIPLKKKPFSGERFFQFRILGEVPLGPLEDAIPIKHLMSLNQVSFQHTSRSANGMADAVGKQGVDCLCSLSAPTM